MVQSYVMPHYNPLVLFLAVTWKKFRAFNYFHFFSFFFLWVIYFCLLASFFLVSCIPLGIFVNPCHVVIVTWK